MSDKPSDNLIDDSESIFKSIPEANNGRRFSISKSGRFKQIVKHREALDEALFNDHKVFDSTKSSKATSSNKKNKKSKNNYSIGRHNHIDDIDALIESSFRPTFEDYKTIRRKSNTSESNTTMDSDGHLETAL